MIATYEVVDASEDTVTLWDGETQDPHRPGRMGGLLTLTVKDHPFIVGQRVALKVKALVERVE